MGEPCCAPASALSSRPGRGLARSLALRHDLPWGPEPSSPASGQTCVCCWEEVKGRACAVRRQGLGLEGCWATPSPPFPGSDPFLEAALGNAAAGGSALPPWWALGLGPPPAAASPAECAPPPLPLQGGANRWALLADSEEVAEGGLEMARGWAEGRGMSVLMPCSDRRGHCLVR